VSAASLPTIPVASFPGGSRVTEGPALNALTLLTVAPPRLESKITQVTTSPSHGLVVQLRNGPSIYFGDISDLAAKWIAATEVLADPGSAGATYIDVSDPARPAAGVSDQAVVAAGLAPDQSQGATGSATQGGGASEPESSGASTPAPRD
jgi:hypothetical protein